MPEFRLAQFPCARHNHVVKPIRFTRKARSHKIGKAHVFHVMATTEPVETTLSEGDPGLVWTGPDDRGVELTIAVLERDDCFLVIHVMPTYPEET